MVGIFSLAIFGSVVSVLVRKMREVHFSIMQFHYGLFATATMMTFIIIEYIVNKNNKELYPFEKFRLLTYNPIQWSLMGVVSVLNSVSQTLFILASQRDKSAFIAVIG